MTSRGSRRANWHETKMLFGNQPLVYVLTRSSRYFGRSCRIPGVGYFINDPALARAILARPDDFGPAAPGGLGDFINRCFGREVRTPFTLTGDRHAEQRRILADVFVGEAMERALRRVLTPECRALAVRLAQGEVVDVAAFTVRAISRVMAYLVGIRPGKSGYDESLVLIVRLGKVLSAGFPIRGHAIEARRLEHLRSVIEDLTSAVRSTTRGATPTDCLLARLRAVGYSEQDCTALSAVMLLAGIETVSSGLPRLIAVLIDHGLWCDLRGHPELLPRTIDEGMRWTMPSPTVTHGIARDCRVEGVDFRAGRRVIVALRNVLRDSRFVDDPDVFRLDREQPPAIRNLWFGGGPHYCFGAPLAIAFYRTALELLLGVSGTPHVRRRRASRGSNFPSYEELLVQFTPS